MERRLEARLEELHAFLGRSSAAEGVEELLAHLRDGAAAAMGGSRASAERCLRLLLGLEARGKDPPSLLSFLDASSAMDDDTRRRELAQAALGVLQLLAAFVEAFGKHRATRKAHALALYRCCQSTARASESNKVKAEALTVIIHVFENCGHLLSAADVEPKVYAEKLFYDLRFGNATQTAKGQMLAVLGSMAKVFRTDLKELAEPLIAWTEKSLEQHFAAASPQFQIISGLLFALARLVAYDPDRYETAAETRKKIYTSVHSVMAATVAGKLSRYHVTRATLQFLTQLAHSFREELAANAYVWFTFMKFCSINDNKTIREHAPACAAAIFCELNRYLVQNRTDANKKSFNRMLKDVLPSITNAGMNSADVGFSINVLGNFSGSIHSYLGESAMLKIEGKLRSYGEALMTMDTKETAKSWSLFSRFVKCTGAFIREAHSTDLDDNYISFVGDILCHVMDAYPFCVWESKATISANFLAIFSAVSNCAVVDNLINRVVYHTLLLSLSTLSDSSQINLYHPETGDVVTELVYSYADFWIELFGRSPKLSKSPFTPESVRESGMQIETSWETQRRKLLDAFMKSLVDLMQSLDLSYSFETQTTVTSNDYGGLKPSVPRDHAIMLNVAELVERVFPYIRQSSFAPWIPHLLKFVVSAAMPLPLISSYYRIGAVLVVAAEGCGCFQDDVESSIIAKASEITLSYANFVELTSGQLQFYQDELLVASAKFILVSPVSLLSVDQAKSALNATLSLGTSFLPAAEIALSALEKWQHEDVSRLEQIAESVIPLLGPYLDKRAEDAPETVQSKNNASLVLEEDQVSDYARLQRRVLIFLGRMGGTASTIISRPPEKLHNSSGQVSLPSEGLILPLQFNDTSASVAIDGIMLEIGEIALRATERRIKVSACETFHSMVSYLCGKTVTQPHTTGSKTPLYGLWRASFAIVMKLAVDPDKVARALFDPLLLQLVRWISSNAETYPFEYADILDHLIGSLSSHASSLRAMATKCITASLRVAVDTRNPLSIERAAEIFGRLFSLCRHPSIVQRSGSAMTVSYFMKSLTEADQATVKTFAIKCLMSLLIALRLSDRDTEVDSGGKFTSQSMIKRAVRKIEQEIARVPDLFNGPQQNENEMSLADITKWLFERIAVRERTFRIVCRGTFVTLSGVVSGSTCKQWVVDYAASRESPLIVDIITPITTIADALTADMENDRMLKWMETFCASVEAYTWLSVVLEDSASAVFASEQQLRTASTKRKRDDSLPHELAVGKQTLEAALTTFFKFRVRNLKQTDSKFAKQEVEYYAEGMCVICELASLALMSKEPALIQVLDPYDPTVMAAVTERVIELFMLPYHGSTNTAPLAVMKQHIGNIVRQSSQWQLAVQRIATRLGDNLEHALENDCGMPQTEIEWLIDSTARVYYELLEIAALKATEVSRYARVFFQGAQYFLTNNKSLPDYYTSVVAAIKTASACGFPVTTLFTEYTLARQFGPLYNDIIRAMSLLPVWRVCVDAIHHEAISSSQALNALTGVLEVVASGKVYKPQTLNWGQFTESLISQVSAFAQHISAAHNNDQQLRKLLEAMGLMLKIFENAPQSALAKICEAHGSIVSDMLIAILSSRAHNYLVKADALHLASTLLAMLRSSACGGSAHPKLLVCLQSFMVAEFPIRSLDVKLNSRDYDVFRTLFLGLLTIVERSGNGMYLQLLFPCLREGEGHLFFEDMQSSLARFSETIGTQASKASRSDLDRSQHLKPTLEMLHDLTAILLDPQEQMLVRQLILERVFIPYIEVQPPQTIQEFFLSEHKVTQSILLVRLSTIAAGASDMTKTQEFGAAVAFHMLEILFRLVDPDSIRGEINEAFLGHKNGKGREFTMLVCKNASKAATTKDTDSSATLEVTQLIRCGAYCCLLTAVSRTQRQEKFFDQLLFQGGVLNNIVDCSVELVLKASTEIFTVVPLSRYSTSTQANRERAIAHGPKSTAKQSGFSSTSQSLAFFSASSLSQLDSLPTMDAAPLASDDAYEGIELELDPLNAHPCMVSLLRTIIEMKHQFGASWDANVMPTWMKKIQETMAQAESHVNVRLFITKLILNVPTIFEPYASTWLPLMLNTLVETGISPDSEFHYLLRDVCVLILDIWPPLGARSDEDEYSRFLNTLIELCPHPNSAVRDDNILLATRLILRWKNIVQIDTGVLADFLLSEEEENGRLGRAKRVTGLQLVSALVSVGLTNSYETVLAAPGKTLRDGIILAMKDPRVPVYTLAAEVGGVYLTTASDDNAKSMDEVVSVILDAYNQEDFQRFLAILRNVSLHKPEIIDSVMLGRVIFALPKAVMFDSWARHGIEAIENATRNQSVRKEIFSHLRTCIDRFIHHRDDQVRLSTLRIIEALLDIIPLSNLIALCSHLSDGGSGLLDGCSYHGDSTYRRLLFDVVQTITEKYPQDDSLIFHTRAALLSGLFDQDSQIQNRVLEFCSSSALLPPTSAQRLLELFNTFYSPDVADDWALYSTNLMLELARQSKDCGANLFSNSLGDGDFVEAVIDTTSGSKTQSMAPLFSLDVDAAVSTDTPSQGLFSLNTFDRTQSQLVSSAIASQPVDKLSSPSGSKGKLNRSRRFVQPRVHMTDSRQSSFGYGDKTAQRRFFQEKNKIAKRGQNATRKRERKARSDHITLRRKYRVGEYPDIQISLQDIVSPLMALCGVHHGTSSRIFSEVFVSVVEANNIVLDQLSTFITRTLEESKTSSAFVGCIHRAYFRCLAKSNVLIDQFQLSSKVLAESSLASRAYYSGELVLEELLIRNTSGAANVKSNGIVAEQWDQLHKIIGTIQKQNFLLAIASKCSAIDESRKALEARLTGNLPTAVASYDKAESILESQMEITGDESSMTVQLDARRCFWQRLGCLETLNSWNKLEHALDSCELGNDGYVWDQQTPYLEQVVGHKLRCALGAKEGDNSRGLEQLQTFVDNAKTDQKRWNLLCFKYAVETTLMFMKLNDESQARIIVDGVYSSFLQQWQDTSALSVVPRLELMQMLSSTVQLDEVLTLVSSPGATSAAYLALVDKWVASCPQAGEGSIAAWSQYYQVQDITNDFMWEHGSDAGLLPDHARQKMSRAKSIVMLGYASAALGNDILALTSRYLKEYRELCNAAQLPKVSVQMVNVFVSHVLKLAERQMQQSDSVYNSVSTDTTVRYFQTATKLFDNADVLELVQTISPLEQVALGSLEAKTFGDAANFYMRADLDHETFEECFGRSLEGFVRSCKACSDIQKTLHSDFEGELIKPRLEFIRFLSELLSSNEHLKWEQIVEKKVVVQHLVNCVLEGMVCGSQECATFFPQLFDLISPFPDITQTFEDRVLGEVPLWTCLQWSAQLMALLNSSTGSTVLKILEKLAEQYPVALFYEFKVSRGVSNSAFAVDVHRLEALLANPTMEKFVEALRLIHHPEIRLKEGLREVSKLLDAKNVQGAHRQMAQVFDDCFSMERRTLGTQIGRYNREWARKARRDIEKILGKNASNLTLKSVSAARDWVGKNFSVCPGKHGITRDMKAHLGDFAEWLDQFDPSKHRLELPGQYTTYWGKPDPSRHVTILSFDSLLGVLPSKQLPKRLTLHCSDERNYTFLVKGGEDLRLDQRIEQLFGVMNHVLSFDPQCRNRQLSNRTYQVIPMTREIGLIEWLDGTSTLKSVIEAQLRQDERCAHLLSNKRQKLELFNTTPAKTYENFLLKQRGASFSAKVIAPTAKDVKKTFDQVQSEVPADMLRRQLIRLGSDYNAFLTIRDRFLASLSVFNACSYVLGIGDRHLDNFLLDLSDGRVVGIDFGVSFGAGASLLPVPELMPFRYTRQMDAVFLPYDGKNLMAQEMQRVFEALRAKKQVIESVLNVFLHEPLMDWQQQTTTFQSEIYSKTSDLPTLVSQSTSEADASQEPEPKVQRTSRAGRSRETASASPSDLTSSTMPLSSNGVGGAWLPNVKIAIARRKLDGFSPQTLLKEELSQNVHLKSHLAKFHALVDAVGGATSSLAGEPSSELSSLAQANELLTLATSPDVLGRTYFGWMPWL